MEPGDPPTASGRRGPSDTGRMLGNGPPRRQDTHRGRHLRLRRWMFSTGRCPGHNDLRQLHRHEHLRHADRCGGGQRGQGRRVRPNLAWHDDRRTESGGRQRYRYADPFWDLRRGGIGRSAGQAQQGWGERHWQCTNRGAAGRGPIFGIYLVGRLSFNR